MDGFAVVLTTSYSVGRDLCEDCETCGLGKYFFVSFCSAFKGAVKG